MSAPPSHSLPLALISSLGLLSGACLHAQGSGSTLPATAPTTSTTAPIAPLTATPVSQNSSQARSAEVACANGQLTVNAQDSSLNQILRAISRCTGMKITGGVPEQRVFGRYGPATPATVLATLLDGTGSNMVLLSAANNQPSELILTPRTGGPTPPPPSSYADNQGEASQPPTNTPPQAAPPSAGPFGLRRGNRPFGRGDMAGNASTENGGNANQTPVLPPITGSVVTSPPSIPQPLNNVNGSPANTSPTFNNSFSSDSVPVDAVPTPSTTPSANGIVDTPNPPPAGSDTAAALNGAPRGTPGTTNISPDATSSTSTPGGTNTTVPADGQSTTPTSGDSSASGASSSGALTPEQVFQQLQQRQQQQQQQQQQSQQQQNM